MIVSIVKLKKEMNNLMKRKNKRKGEVFSILSIPKRGLPIKPIKKKELNNCLLKN